MSHEAMLTLIKKSDLSYKSVNTPVGVRGGGRNLVINSLEISES